MKCDLHVHTLHSGMCTVPVMDRICRESYNDPDEVYRILKGRGMNLVTVTDHDSIEASEGLRHYPDFFLSEEVSCISASGTRLHVGVHDISERQHVELQRRRDDLSALLAYLDEHQLFFAVNHVFSSLTGPRTDHDFAIFEKHFPALETRNGQMLASCNSAAAGLAARWGKAATAGSDAHTLRSLGLTYTEVAGARNQEEFLGGVRRGLGTAQGVSGNCLALTQAVAAIGCAMIRERPSTLALAPLLAAVPLIVLVNAILEYTFARKWITRLGWSLTGMTVSKALSTLSGPDYVLMRRINRWPAPRWIRWWMIASTRGGDGWFWVGCGLILLLTRDPERYAALTAAALAATTGALLFITLKKAVGRKRPCAFEPHCWARLLPPDQFSFPSGHTITAFAVAVSLDHYYPSAQPALLFCAFSTAISRILLGMHFLSDVIAGALLGAALGAGSVWLLSGW